MKKNEVIPIAKLTEKERLGFEEILGQDLVAINKKLIEQIRIFWTTSRNDVMRIKGWDKLIERRTALISEKERIKREINEIEATINSAPLTPEQVVELGGKPDDYGRFTGANFYGVPVTSQFEYEVVQYIRNNINLQVPAKIIHDVCEASIRELTMAGTFEEAREAYNKFYSLDFRKYGVDIPPRLQEIKDAKEKLEMAQQTLSLGKDNVDLYLEYKSATR